MKHRFAIKRLTASDLTLFEWHFRHGSAGNQKAINLNAEVFVDRLYPTLPEIALSRGGRIPLDLLIYGPEGRGPLNLQRKIVKFGSYKNWRLDGEFIHNPTEDPERFNSLLANDLVLFEFRGDDVPVAARAFLASAGPLDSALKVALGSLIGTASMAAVEQSELLRVLQAAATPAGHSIEDLLLSSAVEEAARGDPTARRRLSKPAAARAVTKEELLESLDRTREIGQLGEELVFLHFERLRAAGHVKKVDWASERSAFAPYDFRIVDVNDVVCVLDVKTTSSAFTRPIHISTPEMEEMARGSARYDLYRVYEAKTSGAKLRIATNVRAFAGSVLSGVQTLPRGVEIEGFSIDPTALEFSPEQPIAGDVPTSTLRDRAKP